jgi:putative ABC transport system permease protein
MKQRVRDIGLMKATGCPNDLIFGYFMTELLIVNFVGCFLGVVLGILADFASTSMLNSIGFQNLQYSLNVLLVFLVFALFFALALIFGAKPILDTTKVEPTKAISPTYNLGLGKEPGFRIVSKSGLTVKVALRSMFRRKSAPIRIVVCLAVVFLLLTVAVAGGLIADQTTKKWIEKAIGKDVILIAHKDMCNQYRLLLSKFYESKNDLQFNYTDERYLIPDTILNQLNKMTELHVDVRLILRADVEEVPGYIFDPETSATISIGDNRKGESLIIGVEPEKVLNEWFLTGETLKDDYAQEAVIGDSIAQKMFSMPLNQSIRLFNTNFDVVGVCLDPINNGNVTYISLKTLQNITALSKPNIVMVKIDSSANYAEVLNEIKENINILNPDFEVLELNETLEKNLDFLGYTWSVIMFLSLFSLVAASLCLMSYVILTINEQHQEFGILRAIGARPKTVAKIISWQTFIILLSSYAVGIPLGIIVTLIILVTEPLVTSYTIIQIAGLLLLAFIIMFISSLYPAIKFAKKPVAETMI